MKKLYKSKKQKKKTETQFVNITSLCDGYAQVPDENIEDYKSVYFYVNRDEKILFPFIYNETYSVNGFVEKVIINIKKNELIEIKEGKKITSSL